MTSLMDRARCLEAEGIFLGGPPQLFVTGGAKQLIALLSQGLTPHSKVIDIGCGCLRGGYWLIHFLEKGCYFGIEPNAEMLNGGIELLLEPGLVETKQPHFDHNADFDLAVFGEHFDFFVARSIWTHASKQQIETMLDGFVVAARPDGTFLTSYKPPTLFGSKRDYKGGKWIGRSHESDIPGIVRHSLKWIQAGCAARGLTAKEIKDDAYDFGGQTWLRIKRSVSAK